MILLYCEDENQYIVQVGCDVCMHPRKDKATDFKTRECAQAYLDKWDLWEWEIVEC
ncbi:hypothetical protein VPHK567_0147 [Vibrio phage K567]|nr:hypothetical protein MYOV011v1_p0061 [Vibrio phage 6E35.1a]